MAASSMPLKDWQSRLATSPPAPRAALAASAASNAVSRASAVASATASTTAHILTYVGDCLPVSELDRAFRSWQYRNEQAHKGLQSVTKEIHRLKGILREVPGKPDSDHHKKLEFLEKYKASMDNTLQALELQETLKLKRLMRDCESDTPEAEELAKAYNMMAEFAKKTKEVSDSIVSMSGDWWASKTFRRLVKSFMEMDPAAAWAAIGTAGGVGSVVGGVAGGAIGLYIEGVALTAAHVAVIGGLAVVGAIVGLLVGALVVNYMWSGTEVEEEGTVAREEALKTLDQINERCKLRSVSDFVRDLEKIIEQMQVVTDDVTRIVDATCPICLEEGREMRVPMEMQCGRHYMCSTHWDHYCTSRGTTACPYCRG